MVGPISRGALSKAMHHRQQSTVQESPATRPEDLRVTPWYLDELGNETSSPGGCERGSYPSSYYSRQEKSIAGRPDLYSTRDSSIESSDVPRAGACAPRKAYMDLTDAIALLDETCPNQEASPSLTPRTPRTPLTPFPRSKRARSKSSDNSSNYSNERLSDRSLETSKSQDKERRRPFLRKIGISKTEDRPFLAKIIAPRITGKPYLEKIGPSKAVEKPFLEKIGSSKTLDKFTFDTLRELPRAMVRRCQPMEPSPLSVERTRTHEDIEDDVIVIVKDEKEEDEQQDLEEEVEEEDEEEEKEEHQQQQQHQQNETIVTAGIVRIGSRRANGKGYLLKMYSFETEDLDESTAALKAHRDPLRGASLDDVLDSGPSSLPPSEDSHEHVSPRFQDMHDDRSTSVAELVRCRVTTSEEIFSSSSRIHLGSPREATSWGSSPLWPKRRSRRVSSTPRTRADRDISSVEVFPSDESTPNSPTKRRISRLTPETEENRRIVVSKTNNSSLPRDINASPSKTRRQASEEPSDPKENVELSSSSQHASDEQLEGLTNITKSKSKETRRQTSEGSVADSRMELGNLMESKSRRQIFDEAVEKFGGSEYIATRTRRQVSEEILDRNKENKNSDCGHLDDPQNRFGRRGISSDNLKLSRETVVVSMPSASSLGYQSGDSSLTSQRSSNHSQDFIRGTFKMLHDKFELQEVPVQSYAAFKRRTRTNHNLHHQTTRDKQETLTETTTIPRDSETKDDLENLEITTTTNLTTDSEDSKDYSTHSASEDATESKSSVTVKSVLRKQEGVDHHSDHEAESSCSLRRPKRRIFHEPSQETMDLLTELRKVKSLLGTPSPERDIDLDFSKPVRFPKKILLTDKEFCLSVERENSIRRPSILHLQPDSAVGKHDEERKTSSSDSHNKGNVDDSVSTRTIGPALFEKRCMSLDYADDDKPPKPEARAISLASARSPRSGTEGTIDLSDPGLADDAKSYCSEVFTTPSEEPEDIQRLKPESAEETTSESKPQNINHCAEVDIAIPVDQLGSVSPKRRIHMQGRTSDLYEIISPRSTPFRVKKRLGRISVEETVKQESFTLNKVDCRSVATQKRTKCFPL